MILSPCDDATPPDFGHYGAATPGSALDRVSRPQRAGRERLSDAGVHRDGVVVLAVSAATRRRADNGRAHDERLTDRWRHRLVGRLPWHNGSRTRRIVRQVPGSAGITTRVSAPPRVQTSRDALVWESLGRDHSSPAIAARRQVVGGMEGASQRCDRHGTPVTVSHPNCVSRPEPP